MAYLITRCNMYNNIQVVYMIAMTTKMLQSLSLSKTKVKHLQTSNILKFGYIYPR